MGRKRGRKIPYFLPLDLPLNLPPVVLLKSLSPVYNWPLWALYWAPEAVLKKGHDDL